LSIVLEAVFSAVSRLIVSLIYKIREL
jgi:hypothetical protein